MVANGLWNALSSSHRVPPLSSPPLPCQRTLATWFRDWVGHLENWKISLILFLGHALALPERYSTCSLYSPPSVAVDNKYDYTLEMDHADTSTVQYPRPLIVEPIHYQHICDLKSEIALSMWLTPVHDRHDSIADQWPCSQNRVYRPFS